MVNNNGPFGFRYLGLNEGSPPNFGVTPGQIAAATGPVYSGDVLTIANGVLSPAAVVGGGAQIAGIAVSFEWVSIANGYKVRRPWYPGNDSVNAANITVFYANNPNAIFEVQGGGQSGVVIPQSAVGKYANFAVGAGGNQKSGISSYNLDDSTINAVLGNLPFVITLIELAPKTDPTSQYNLVRVRAVNLNPGA